MFLNRILFLFLSFASLIQGQDSIRVDFRMLSLSGPLEDLAVLSPAGLVDVNVPSYDRSDVFTYKGSSRMRFVRKGDVSTDGSIAQVLFEAQMPADVLHPLIIVTPAPQESSFRYHAIVLADGLQDLPGGSSYFINASPYPIAMLFDQKDEPIKMMPKGIVKRSFEEGAHNIRVQVASYAEGEIRMGLDSRIYPMPVHRDIYFIYARQGANAGRLGIRRMREHENSAARYFREAAQQ